MYGNPEVTSGGNALKFYASVRLEVRRKQTTESSKGDSIGIRVKAKVRLGTCHVRVALCSSMQPYLHFSTQAYLERKRFHYP